jgi:hypothetical protein
MPTLISVEKALVQLFGKTRKGIDILPPTRDALEIHGVHANRQAKIWL